MLQGIKIEKLEYSSIPYMRALEDLLFYSIVSIYPLSITLSSTEVLQ